MAATLAVIGLCGCVSARDSAVPDTRVPILFDANGIAAIGTGQRIDFGRAQDGVLQTMTRLQRGPPTPVACAAGTAFGWGTDTVLIFDDGAFSGWRIDDPALSQSGALATGRLC